MMARFFLRCFLFFAFAAFFYGCSCSNMGHSRLRIGIDSTWYPLDFGAQQSYVNGFTQELLMDVATYSGIEFECMEANWDSLFNGLQKKKYDAVLSSLAPYDFHLARYDFSDKLLDLGPVLLVPVGSRHLSLDSMRQELVGLLVGDAAVLQLQKYSNVILRTYASIPELLDAVVQGEISGAVLNQILAVNYVRDLYVGKLMITGAPMTDAGLRLVTLKGENEHIMKMFNKSLQFFRKKKKLRTLLQKWELS